MLRELLQEVLDLQPDWNARKTASMDRRGIIVRREIPSLIRDHFAEVTTHSLTPGLEWAVEGRDGTGPKTEIPWVRVYDKALSPSATTGWYVVYLFSAFGDRLYLSLGRGSTEWTGVEFKPRPESELRAMTSWARELVRSSSGVSGAFSTEIDLQARRSNLGAAYEAGTVLAKSYASGDLPPDEILWTDLSGIVSSLSILYGREMSDPMMPGVDPPEVRELVDKIQQAAGKLPRKRSTTNPGGQGFGLSQGQKVAVERHAVEWATRYYRAEGWVVRDVGATHSYDLHAKRGGEVLHIEVKGTTSAGRSVVLTANEVDWHRSKYPDTALFLVSGILLAGTRENPVASEGSFTEIRPWIPSEHDLVPMAFRYQVPLVSGGTDEAPAQ